MTIEQIKRKLDKPLAGIDAQIKMAPLFRITDRYDAEPPGAVKSAVAIVFEEDANHRAFFYLMRRAEDGYAHSGQISFPGGRKDPEDANLQQTAVRELYEEIGLSDCEFMKQLTPLYVPISNYSIYPFVFWVQPGQRAVPDPQEVAQIFKVPVSDLRNHNSIKRGDVQTRNITLNVPYFCLQQQVVWGATAMMLSELRTMLL